MKLTEILHVVSDEKKKGLVNLDDWKYSDADHLKSMGFDFNGDYIMSMPSPPIKVYKRKMPQGECFVMEEKGKGEKIFTEFEKLVEFFDHYSQPDIDKETD